MPDIDSIIQSNLGLIYSQIKRLRLTNDQEAESIGYEALYNAILTFDEGKGYKLSTYATCCIYNALGCYIRTLNRKRRLDVISFNNTAYSDDSGKHDFEEFLTEDVDASQEVIRDELVSTVREAYFYAYNRLTNTRQRAIVEAWHNSDYTMLNKDLAILTNCSQPYVNQVINTFKFKLRQRLERYYHG